MTAAEYAMSTSVTTARAIGATIIGMPVHGSVRSPASKAE
jgi:hypothetical protein